MKFNRYFFVVFCAASSAHAAYQQEITLEEFKRQLNSPNMDKDAALELADRVSGPALFEAFMLWQDKFPSKRMMYLPTPVGKNSNANVRKLAHNADQKK